MGLLDPRAPATWFDPGRFWSGDRLELRGGAGAGDRRDGRSLTRRLLPMPTLILLRHGQSEWNLANRFTGWVDVDLSEQGEREAVESGRLLRDAGVVPDVVHTSVQKRAIRTAELALRELDRLWIPVRRSWRLNERHYGALQGLDKRATAERYGAEQVKAWRRGYATPPPPLDAEALAEQARDPRYANLPPDALPASECLADVVARMLPYWYDGIVPDLMAGRAVLVAAHGNSLRALVKHLDGISDDDIVELNIPTGIPLVYDLDARLRPIGSRYLGDPEAARAAAEAVARQAG
jgi:2,3-bisphosphoglycerate-dependent phosphoglycerate mutase